MDSPEKAKRLVFKMSVLVLDKIMVRDEERLPEQAKRDVR